jgi:hypothetical protein
MGKHTVVFGSPRRLNLQAVCRPTPVSSGRYWISGHPSIVINQSELRQPTWGANDTIAALEHKDRVPVLIDLWLESDDETLSVDPDLLFGSAPCLQFLQLVHIPFPGLSKPLTISPIPDTVFPRRWSRASPRCCAGNADVRLRSRILEFQCGERILGGPRRCPFTRQVACTSRSSTQIRHFTTRTVHRSHTNAHDTMKHKWYFSIRAFTRSRLTSTGA